MPAAISLYVHIPFCSKKCPYCAFYKDIHTDTKEADFVKALSKEIEAYKNENISIKTLFFGGGTPTKLSLKNLTLILKKIYDTYDTSELIEISLEANPESLSLKKLIQYKALGINRISLGVQSYQEEELKFLGRWHTRDHINTALNALHSQKWNFNVDLIFGLPHSSLESLSSSLQHILSFSPSHISTYALSIEENTPFEKKGIRPTSNQNELKQYDSIIETLTKYHYTHYEVSAFSKNGARCNHNLSYWTFTPYIGLGPSASSFYQNKRYTHAASLKKYIEDPTPPLFQAKYENLSQKELIQEFLIANLRRPEGFSKQRFKHMFNQNFTTLFQSELEDLCKKKWLTQTEEDIKVTPSGLRFLNDVLLHFI